MNNLHPSIYKELINYKESYEFYKNSKKNIKVQIVNKSHNLERKNY